MSMGIFTFAEQFAKDMTSDAARASTDKDQFRTDSWEGALPLVRDEALREILKETGPHNLGPEFRSVVNRIFDQFEGSSELPHILIALSLLYGGFNPRFMRGWVENFES